MCSMAFIKRALELSHITTCMFQHKLLHPFIKKGYKYAGFIMFDLSRGQKISGH